MCKSDSNVPYLQSSTLFNAHVNDWTHLHISLDL